MKQKLILKKWQKMVLLCVLPFFCAAGLLLAKNLYARFVVPWMPPCFLRTLTGLKCPSCGMTHAVYALCRLDIAEAMRQNALLLFGVLLLVLRYLEMWLTVLGKPRNLIPRRGIVWAGIALFWLGYTILRNILHL